MIFASLATGLSSARGGETSGLAAGVIRTLPRTAAEVAAVHDKNEANACQPVPANEPLEIADFKHRVSYQLQSGDAGKPVQRVLEFEVSRRTVVTAGAAMDSADQNNLPLISGGKILSCVNDFYIGAQVRVHREGASGEPHLFHRPFGYIGAYKDPRRTQDYVDIVRNSVREIRSIGLYVKPGIDVTAETLRTLVLVNRNLVADAGTGTVLPNYEMFFVRARPDPDKPGDLLLHAFVTTKQRSLVHQLRQHQTPKTVDDCDIKSTIFFTDFGFGKLMPTGRASRRSVINHATTFSMAELDAYAQSQGWEGDALANLTETLDALIDGKLKPADKTADKN
jgi:hypothetical protein